MDVRSISTHRRKNTHIILDFVLQLNVLLILVVVISCKSLKICETNPILVRKRLCSINTNITNVFIYLVILKIRSKRTQRNTEMPRGDMILVSTRMVSRIPPQTTKLSKRLKSETKYACGERGEQISKRR